MKYLRLFESKTNIDIFDYFRERNKIEEIGDKILELVQEYIKINSEHFLRVYSFDTIIKSKVIGIDLKEPFTLIIYDKYGHAHELKTDDFNDLLNFIEDPEAYKASKKYNL